jgi:cell wall assembly regulator SMI1
MSVNDLSNRLAPGRPFYEQRAAMKELAEVDAADVAPLLEALVAHETEAESDGYLPQAVLQLSLALLDRGEAPALVVRALGWFVDKRGGKVDLTLALTDRGSRLGTAIALMLEDEAAEDVFGCFAAAADGSAWNPLAARLLEIAKTGPAWQLYLVSLARGLEASHLRDIVGACLERAVRESDSDTLSKLGWVIGKLGAASAVAPQLAESFAKLPAECRKAAFDDLAKGPAETRAVLFDYVFAAEDGPELLGVFGAGNLLVRGFAEVVPAAKRRGDLASFFLAAKAVRGADQTEYFGTKKALAELGRAALEHAVPKGDDARKLGGLLACAATAAFDLGEIELAHTLYARANELPRPFLMGEEEYEDPFEGSPKADLEAIRSGALDRSKALASLAEDGFQLRSNEARVLFGAAGAQQLYERDERSLNVDALRRVWLVDGEDRAPELVGATLYATYSYVRDLADGPAASELFGRPGELRAAVLAGNRRNVVVLSEQTALFLAESTAILVELAPGMANKLDALIARQGAEADISTYEIRMTVDGEKYPFTPSSLYAALARGEIFDGFRIEGGSTEEENPTLGDWLKALAPEDIVKIPEQLARMGLEPSFATVTRTEGSRESLAKAGEAWLEPGLARFWETYASVTLTLGSSGVRFLTVEDALSRVGTVTKPSLDNPARYTVLAVDPSDRPLLIAACDDGELELEEHRYAFLGDGGKEWDTGWAFAPAVSQLVTKLTLGALNKVTRDAEYTKLDATLKKKTPKKVARPADAAAAWKAIESYLKKNAEDVTLKKGAKEAAVRALEKKLSVELPAAMTASWMRHNGDDESGAFAGWSMMDLDGIESETNFWRDYQSEASPPADDPRIAPTWWDPSWVAFASSGGGDFLVVDLSKKGNGQVFYAIMDPPERAVVASSFEEWLLDYAHALASENLSCQDGEWDDPSTFLLKRRE